MTREEKNSFISELTDTINNSSVFYLSDVSDIDAENTSKLRRLCHKRGVKLQVVKNTLLKKAFENAEGNYEEFYPTLAGNTSIMFSEVGNAPAKIIKEFRKKNEKPVLKGAYVDEAFFIGDDQVNALSELKSKEELIAEIVMLLQSPAKNVVSALQSGGNTIAGLVKTLSEREAN